MSLRSPDFNVCNERFCVIMQFLLNIGLLLISMYYTFNNIPSNAINQLSIACFSVNSVQFLFYVWSLMLSPCSMCSNDLFKFRSMFYGLIFNGFWCYLYLGNIVVDNVWDSYAKYQTYGTFILVTMFIIYVMCCKMFCKNYNRISDSESEALEG